MKSSPFTVLDQVLHKTSHLKLTTIETITHHLEISVFKLMGMKVKNPRTKDGAPRPLGSLNYSSETAQCILGISSTGMDTILLMLSHLEQWSLTLGASDRYWAVDQMVPGRPRKVCTRFADRQDASRDHTYACAKRNGSCRIFTEKCRNLE
ncbi:hypothetical protein CHS0354_038528 [Potamilus streckersoni]|uniref:Uncharacterized protein n=1 Tax=Potamilus streckersoni TaxID=2493646 RepID=A0AAE0VQ83_9BIVA|nr:hypothetical protein CHS0354_038528 [Potamilus streckersoni]